MNKLRQAIKLLWFIFIGCTLQAKEIIIVPCDRFSFDLNWYSYSPELTEDRMSCWQFVHRDLLARGDTIRLSNLSEFTNSKTTKKLLKNVRKVIFNNIPSWTNPAWKQKLKWIGKKKCMLIGWEPPSVLPDMYTSHTLSFFSIILTWDDSLIDNKKFFKMQYPVYSGMIEKRPYFFQKKFVTQISGNKSSPHKHELYSERLDVIKYFEKRRELGFEFFGSGWANEGHKTYRGAPQDKIDVLKNYRYSFCYENITNIKGYITEKIFDCFTAGCVPIYWGATNIEKYIPKNCYINRTDFSSMDKLIKHLAVISEKKHEKYITNIEKFLKSSKAKAFTKQALAKVIVKHAVKK